MVCKPDEEEDAALCYPPCEYGADGVGPVCWGHCPTGTTSCGALCLLPGESCAGYSAAVAIDVAKAVAAADSGSPGIIIDMSKIASDFNYPECPNW